MAQLPVCSTIAGANTNATTLSFTRDCEPTVSSEWIYMELNADGLAFSPEITSVARDPLSLKFQRKAGTVTALAAAPTASGDMTMDLIRQWTDAFMWSAWKGPAVFGLLPTAVTASGYTVPAGTALAAGTLVRANNWSVAGNNGVKVVEAGSTTTNVAVTGLTAETAPTTAVLHVVGVQGATGDIEIDANGDLISTVLDFTTLGLTVGQVIFIGGETTATKFATADNYGYARVESIAANLIELSSRDQAFTADDGAGKTIQIYISSFCRDVEATHADALIVKGTAELILDSSPVNYVYSLATHANTMTINTPLEDKATVDLAFVAKDMAAATTTRKDGVWRNVRENDAFNTSTDFSRIRLASESDTDIDIYVNDGTLTIDNGLSTSGVLGNLGAAFVNRSNRTVSFETAGIYVGPELSEAVRNYTPLAYMMGFRNNDGAVVFDMPNCRLSDGALQFSQNEKVTSSITIDAFEDGDLGYTLGVSCFGYVPAV